LKARNHGFERDATYLAAVRDYWQKTHRAYLESVGTTLQASRIKVSPAEDPVTASNLYLADAARILPGDRVLDAGCGVCGPAIDIARSIERVSIAAITISHEQAITAHQLVRQAELHSHIQVLVGDFHHLPLAASMFDVAYFFESCSYCYNPNLLFSEIRRVLRPGGRIYIKDVFRRKGPLSEEEKNDLCEFDRTFTSRTSSMEIVARALATSGFSDVRTRDLSGLITTLHALEAMFTLRAGLLQPTDFGRTHFRIYRHLPILYGEVQAVSAAGD
jgi:SAM-dependent methyltransferase